MCFVPVTVKSLSTSSEGRDKPKSVWPVLMQLSLSVRVLVLSTCCAESMDRLPHWAPLGFSSGQSLCVLCQQSVVQMSRYTQALGARLDSWRPSSVLVAEKERGGGLLQSDSKG